MIKTILFSIFIVFILYPMEIAPFNFFQKIKESETQLLISDVTETFMCDEDIVERIKRFTIAKNNSFECHESYIGINFELVHPYNKTIKMKSFGYIKQDKGCITFSQKVVSVCPKIRKYDKKFFLN
jgi:hypothetical protein